MRNSCKVLYLTVLFIVFICFRGFCSNSGLVDNYSELVGKRAQIHGPYCWEQLGVAVNETACDYLISLSRLGQKESFRQELENFDIFRIDKNAKVLVLNIKLFEGKAEVALLSGIYIGRSGWIPVEWLKGNSQRPGFTDYPPDYPKSSILRVE